MESGSLPAASVFLETPRVSKSQFKAHALELFRQVEGSGVPLVITDRGRPVLEVRPYHPTDPNEKDLLDQLRGSVLHDDDPFTPVAEGEWEALA
jgi:antitoxin (DNA-binding transcriptional repressor) of toxin-antitoxin stability system